MSKEHLDLITFENLSDDLEATLGTYHWIRGQN